MSMLLSRDELDLRASACASSSSACSSASPSGCVSARFAASEGAGDADGTGPLGTLRRSLRQLNPFKSRLFRLPATPRLSRSKKVLGRGEELTGWNFERPSAASSAASLRPFSSSFGSADIPPNCAIVGAFRPPPQQQRRRMSQMEEMETPLQPSPMLLRRQQQQYHHHHHHQAHRGLPGNSGDECNCCGASEGLEDLDEFLCAMESIARRGELLGGSCRVGQSGQHAGESGGRRTVATAGMLPGPGTRRARPPIPAFAPPQVPAAEVSRSIPSGHRHSAAPIDGDFRFLPSTCYAPDGEMYAARWHPSASPASVPHPPHHLPSPRALPRRHPNRRPVGLLLENNPGPSEQFGHQQPKSPSQSSAITLLNTAGRGMRSASTSSQHQAKQTSRPALNGLFPQTQLQRRRSACSALEQQKRGGGGGGIAEEAEEDAEAATANYYGKEVIRLMEEGTIARRDKRQGQTKAPDSPSGSPASPHHHPRLLPTPSPLFPFPDELCLAQSSSSVDPFVGREWLFRELCHQLQTERAQLILLQGASGCGKSAVLRHIVAHSHFGDNQREKNGVDVPQQQQHNTVDSGIAIGGNGGTSSSTASGGGNSSGSQLSLLNLSLHPSLDHPDPVPLNSPGQQWLHSLAKCAVAFHFAHLHNALSCSVAEFVRSLCAQMCVCPPLKHSYGKMIRSDPDLHRLATQEAASLAEEPLELFRKLISGPIAKLYREEEERNGGGGASARERQRSPSKGGSDYGSNYGSGERPTAPPPPPPTINICSPDSPATSSVAGDRVLAPLPPFLLVLVDSLDEASFHRTDGGECVGWLLRRALSSDECDRCPPQLRFVCSVTVSTRVSQHSLGEFGTLRGGDNSPEARSIRLDDWETDERIARDLRVFVERRVQSSPALDKWVGAQFRRQSFFAVSGASAPPTASEFGTQLVAHLDGNFVALQLALNMLAEGRALSLDALPPSLDQLYSLHFRHKFPCPGQFRPLSSVLGVLLASLRPLSVDELLRVLNYSAGLEHLDEQQLRESLALLHPLFLPLTDKCTFVPAHPSLREWMLKECVGPGAEFRIDIRFGHILLALSIIRSSASPPNPSPEQMFDLAHHLLKANPHKYMDAEMANALGMPAGRDAQVQWLRKPAEGAGSASLATALLFRRNVFYPNSKVSRLLLLAGADPNCAKWPDGTEEPLLCAFTCANNPEMVQLLLQFGANPNLGSPPPLIIAVQSDHEKVARHLCAHRADLCGARDPKGHGALYNAAARDALGMVAFLLDVLMDGAGNKAPICAGSMEELRVADRRYSACSSSYDEDRRGEQQKNGKMTRWRMDPTERTRTIREAFEVAAERGSTRVCRYLLDNADAVLDMSRAMCIACANGCSEVVQFLLSRGATLAPEQSWNGKSALVCAVESGSWDLVVNVLNGGGPGSAEEELNRMSGPDKLSPLMVAARHGHVGLVDLLINRGARVDAADAHGRTAAMHAIEAGHSSTVALLLERGCALFARDEHGNTMMHFLARHPNKCLINRLLEAGLPLEDKNSEDLRPIEVAIQSGQLLAVDTFLRRGARLRSLTWQIALRAHPPLVLVLLRKLLDDAQILLRRKRCTEAQHRFSYALQKCDELVERADAGDAALQQIRAQLRRCKTQTLHSMAALKRRCNDLREAISLASQALEILGEEDEKQCHRQIPSASGAHPSSSEEEAEAGTAAEEEAQRQRREGQRFELHLLRAKCHFDARDLDRARVDAQLAACLRPGDAEAQNLVAVLNMG